MLKYPEYCCIRNLNLRVSGPKVERLWILTDKVPGETPLPAVKIFIFAKEEK